MRRGLAGGLIAAVLITLAVVSSPRASADPPVCLQLNPATGVCIVWSGGDGSSGSSASSSGGNSATDTASDTCHWDTSNGHAPGVVPCSSGGGVWNGFCYLSLLIPQPPKSFDQWQGHTTGAIYVCSAPGPGEPQAGIVGLEFWFATPPPGLGPDPAELAQQALATLTIPAPAPGRYPAGIVGGWSSLHGGDGLHLVLDQPGFVHDAVRDRVGGWLFLDGHGDAVRADVHAR